MKIFCRRIDQTHATTMKFRSTIIQPPPIHSPFNGETFLIRLKKIGKKMKLRNEHIEFLKKEWMRKLIFICIRVSSQENFLHFYKHSMDVLRNARFIPIKYSTLRVIFKHKYKNLKSNYIWVNFIKSVSRNMNSS